MHLVPDILRDFDQVLLVQLGDDDLVEIGPQRRQGLSLRPPIGRTRPRRVTSPVIARRLITFLPVIAE